MVKAELILSRSGYQTGTPIVGSVRLTNPENTTTKNNAKSAQYPIRNDIVSARLYLAGRAHIGGNARTGKGSRWRSLQEINQLKKIYGADHACLSLAKVEEETKWSNEWSGTSNKDGNESTFNRAISPPKVTHIEQAERLEVETYLHPSNKTNANEGGNDYSQLPTPHENNTVCFWMTNVLELVDIPERHEICNTSSFSAMSKDEENSRSTGRGKFHGDMNPYRPLQLPDLNVVQDVCKKEKKVDNREECKQEDKDEPSPWDQIVASANQSNDISANDDNLSSEATPLEHTQLAFSFRANLPSDVPPTMSAECVKYFYSAVLVVTTSDGELIVTQCPYTVFSTTSNSQQHSSSQSQPNQTSLTRVHVGDLHAIAHSAGLPTYITSTEASDATPAQLNVNTNPPSCDIVSRRTAEKRTSTHRIVDGKDSFCGLMTLVGVGGPLVPGTRLGIRVRFPIDENDECCNGAGIIPCHRVCCALVGEEYAIFEDSTQTTGTDNQPNNKGIKKRVKTRSYVFDSKYELVESGYTEAISMGLLLPMDCPVTVKTDLVEVSVSLKIEFTTSNIGTERKFSTIRLDLPCTVVHINNEEGLADEDDGNTHTSSIRTMQQYWNDDTNNEGVGFDDTDIQDDLKALSLRMINQI